MVQAAGWVLHFALPISVATMACDRAVVMIGRKESAGVRRKSAVELAGILPCRTVQIRSEGLRQAYTSSVGDEMVVQDGRRWQTRRKDRESDVPPILAHARMQDQFARCRLSAGLLQLDLGPHLEVPTGAAEFLEHGRRGRLCCPTVKQAGGCRKSTPVGPESVGVHAGRVAWQVCKGGQLRDRSVGADSCAEIAAARARFRAPLAGQGVHLVGPMPRLGFRQSE